MRNEDDEVFLTTGDPGFHDLFFIPKGSASGIRLQQDSQGTIGASVLIGGFAGTGKTTLACHICAVSLLTNNKKATERNWKAERWPRRARAVIFTLDQRAEEIKDLLGRLAPELKNVPDLDNKSGIKVFHDPKSEGTREAEATERRHDALMNSRILIVKIPYDTPATELTERIAEFTSKSEMISDEQVKIVVVDSVNHMAHEVDDGKNNALKEFRKLLGHGEEKDGTSTKKSFSTILTFEVEPRAAFPEEFLPQVSIMLTREEDDFGRRLLEIRKARHQHHFIGRHDFRIDENGVKTFPSIATRAKILQLEFVREDGVKEINFGLEKIDVIYKKDNVGRLYQGSTSIVWGPPGAGKSDLLIWFLVQQWRERESRDSRVLLVTTKINPDVVRRDIISLVSKDVGENGKEGLADVFGREIGGIAEAVRNRFVVVDARNPFLLQSVTMASIVDAVDGREPDAEIKWPSERAVLFGVSSLEEAVEIRDEQWRLFSVLVWYLGRRRVSTLLVDWPIGGKSGEKPERPRATKLCANELSIRYSETGPMYVIQVHRANYSSIEEPAEYSAAEFEIDSKE